MSCNCLQRSVLYSYCLLKLPYFGNCTQSQEERKYIFLLSLFLLVFQVDASEALLA